MREYVQTSLTWGNVVFFAPVISVISRWRPTNYPKKPSPPHIYRNLENFRRTHHPLLPPPPVARTSPKLIVLLTIFTFFIIHIESVGFSRTLSQGSKLLKREKMSHLHFYFHDIVGGRNATAIRVAEATSTKTSPTVFGAVSVMDDPLTERPEATSKLVGRAQGIYASASQNELALLMNLNFAFMEGKYNGSTLSILGRNTVFSEVREMPVVGGSGVFRLARGYAHAKTHWFDPTTGDAVVEYNIYVIHYY
ncbi:dirigent protein 21-like [Macadamia integrifolia]|uniref:dirigent protein 21-like n=1 Tax=Macadamia integrifolia TaxID=60698 RepID=UPI001C4FA6FD|nr:dirigent protein 21-like [Macadamia integrifolia]